EELHIKRRCRFRFWMPLNADAEPVRIGGFNRLDHSIRRLGAYAQLGAGLTHSLMMVAVHANLPAAVNLVESGACFHQHSMAMRPTGCVAVWQGSGQIFREMQEEAAAA